ncbi:Zinc-binding domain of primase-helicase [Stieleria maiorica]|uniref:Zinc-binding domain of primase-helicase n=1 Tax=Stieleria maiorica TaxID=2795974 RepID=A0A5B9MAI1_9BACT|nr:primase-helicase zinc-binding domain-containing protein [Stieleria maiorica]QEF97683.1 Zinc-binding domain of primase-helicase [Stieleria maiorica]
MPYYDLNELRRAAMGRWGEILISAGIPAAVLDGRNHPCPKCGGRDRFAAFGDLQQRGAVHCRRCFTRGCAIRPGDGIATLRWWLGCSFAESLAFLADVVGVRPAVGSPRNRPAATPSSGSASSSCSAAAVPIDQSAEAIDKHTAFARDAYHRIDAATRRRLAEQLTVSQHALQRLRVGVTADGNGSTWPMRNEHEQVIGVRISGLPWTQKRNCKWSRRGSQSGIFIARPTTGPGSTRGIPETLYVTEGASDTAAAITLGWWAIGRASCSASTFFVDRYIHRHQPQRLAIVADNDEAGRSGAKRLAKSLCQTLPRSLSHVDVIAPPAPANDLRVWAAMSPINLADATTIATIRSKTQKTFQF